MVASWAPLAMKRHLLSLSPTSISLSMAPSPTTYHSPPIQHLLSLQVLRRRPPSGFNAAVRLVPPHVSMARKAEGSFDPELRKVLELASNTELYELERILFGPSYLSPLIKSISSGAEFDHVMIEEDLQERENFIEALESRFLYLAADARSTLRLLLFVVAAAIALFWDEDGSPECSARHTSRTNPRPPRRLRHQSLHLALSKQNHLFGSRPNGAYYRTTLNNDLTVVVKRLHPIEIDTQHVRRSSPLKRKLQLELQVLAGLRHRHLMSFRAYVRQPDGHFFLVYVYMPDDSLRDAMDGVRQNEVQLGWETRLRIVVGIVKGLKFLHFDCMPRVLYHNLKPSKGSR
ncbi:hypothetical protein Dimus_027005 [Dionaea muscipula]